MNQYEQLKERQQKEVNDVLNKYAFFAFNEQQFKDGAAKLGVTDKEGSIVSLGGTGGFILKDKAPDFMQMIARHRQERDSAAMDPDFAVDMFRCELANHEYSYTGSDADALDALGYTPDDIAASEVLSEALRTAKEDVLREG